MEGTMGSNIEERVQLMWDRQEIERVLRLYCRAIDRLDLDLLRSVYHCDATDAHGSFDGNAQEFAEFIMGRLPSVTSYGFHTITNSIIDVDGDRAVAESSYYGYHRIPGGLESIAAYFGEPYAAAAQRAGTIEQEHEYICGGRYLDRFERRRDSVWRIAQRKITNEWSQCQPTTQVLEGSRADYNLPGARDRSDPMYQLTL
jgi:hypothetical protein